MLWSDEDIKILKECYEQGESSQTIAEKLGKTVRAVRNKAYKLKITNANSFTDEEIDYIQKNYKSYNLKEISDTLGRPKTSVCRIAKSLGLEMSGKKKETTKPKRKFATQEELTEWKREYKKQWHATHDHPRGMLGKHHKKEYCEEISKRVKHYWENVTPEMLEERRKKQVATRIKNDTLNPNKNSTNAYSRTKSGKREDISNTFFRSSWEANIARLFNLKGIKWEYEPKTFYFNNSMVTSYTPDFYLPQYDVWVEVKGWFDEKSKNKLKAFTTEFPKEKLWFIGKKEYKEICKEHSKSIPNWE